MSMSSRADTRMKELAFSAMFAALALIFSYVEVLIPIPIPIPGVKLGVANLVIIIALYRMGFRRAFSINCARIVMAGLLFSGVFGSTAIFVLCNGSPSTSIYPPQIILPEAGKHGATIAI